MAYESHPYITDQSTIIPIVNMEYPSPHLLQKTGAQFFFVANEGLGIHINYILSVLVDHQNTNSMQMS